MCVYDVKRFACGCRIREPLSRCERTSMFEADCGSITPHQIDNSAEGACAECTLTPVQLPSGTETEYTECNFQHKINPPAFFRAPSWESWSLTDEDSRLFWTGYSMLYRHGNYACTPRRADPLSITLEFENSEPSCTEIDCILWMGHSGPHLRTHPCSTQGCSLEADHPSPHQFPLGVRLRELADVWIEAARVADEQMRTLNQVVLEAMRAPSDTREIEHRRRTREKKKKIRQNETLDWKVASTTVHESSGLTYGTLNRSGQQIRLFELLPGTGMTDVVGGFHCIDLSKCPAYTALSYAWGDQTDSENMKIDGGTTISVRKNLWWFLHLQQSTITQPKLFWIDAMCINQDDVHERNHQVGLMKLIYATAADVCIWLGRESEDSDLAMEFIAKKGTHGLRARGPGFYPLWKKKEGLALAALCDRPYWTRMWIIQEIIHAKKITVWCGAKEFNWASFESLYLSLKALEDNSWAAHHCLVTNVLQSSACVMVWQRAHWRHPDTPIPSLQTLIEVFHEWKCADVRDKVYALAGMANNETSIVPDYERSPKQLYFAVQERNPSCEEKFFNLLSQVLVLPGKDIELPGQSLIEYKSHPPERIVLRKRMNDENW